MKSTLIVGIGASLLTAGIAKSPTETRHYT